MKKLQHRTFFVLLFILLLCAGLVILTSFYVTQGAQWASFSANRHVFSDGSIASGAIKDRNGEMLYNCGEGTYSEDWGTRVSTLHAVGDRHGSIAGGAKTLFADHLVGFNLIAGTTGTGNTVMLTLDTKLNRTAYSAMDGRHGTASLYNYKTGELLCMVTTPTFDPDDEEEIAQVNAGDSDYEGAYLNRFLSATYTPGSTFKLVTTAAALESLKNGDSFTYDCDGVKTVEGERITCTEEHGEQNLSQALTNSCNGAFATLAIQMGGEALQKYAESAGLLRSVEVSGMTSATGSFTFPGRDNDLGWAGVGQFRNLVNPCSELTLMGCIAGGGKAATPRLLESVTNTAGIPIAHVSKDTSSIGWKKSTCERLTKMMHDNVVNKYSEDLDFGKLNVCAKSGTAEVGGGKRPHSWFVGFLDEPDYPYAFVVLVENGGWGTEAAGNVAAKLVRTACEIEE